MTKTVQNNLVLMYEGQLQEYYLTQDGQFSYVVLSDCKRFFLDFNTKPPMTSPHIELFRTTDGKAGSRLWNYLQIDGSNILCLQKAPYGSVLDNAATMPARTAAANAALDRMARPTSRLRRAA